MDQQLIVAAELFILSIIPLVLAVYICKDTQKALLSKDYRRMSRLFRDWAWSLLSAAIGGCFLGSSVFLVVIHYIWEIK